MRRLLLLLVAVVGCYAQDLVGMEGSGPQMVNEPLNSIFNTDSNIQSTYLDCEADGDERPTYTWKKDGNPVNTGADSRYQLSRGRLTITNPRKNRDTGVYQCFPSNQIGTIMSRMAKLEFAFVDYFAEFGPADMIVPLNTGVCISCNVPDHYPGVKVFWYKGLLPVLQSSRMHTTVNGRLCFANFMAIDNGEYKCYVLNSIDAGGGSSAAKFSDDFSVTADDATSDDPLHGPTVAIGVEDVEVLVNTPETTLSCFFSGNPVPSIHWRRKTPAGAELPSLYELKLDNQQLVLKNIQVDDAGEYECYTEEGDGRSSGNVFVTVPPTWVQEIENTNGNINEDATFECEAESPNGVNYNWYRNAVEITDLPRHQLSNRLKRLTIMNLTVTDTGMYQCVASNFYGEIYTTAQLTVLVIKPWFRTELEIDQPAPRGGSITIVCQPEAAPPPEIQWTKGSQILSSDGHYTILDNGNLMISDIVDADEAEYTCTATNSIGTGSSTGSIVVRDRTAIVQGPQDLTIDEGELGILTCLATHDLLFDLQYVWMKDGMQVDMRLSNYEQPEVRTGEASELHIKDATMELGGVYTCMTITSIDEVAASAVVTIRGRPGPPAGISVVVKGLAANISWSHGADNNSPILSYIIEGSTDHEPTFAVLRSDIPAASTHIRLTGLSAWSLYKFRVIAVNEIGQSDPSEESDEQETAQDRPTMAPSDVGGGKGNEGDLRMTWTPLPRQEWNAPNLTYKVFWRQQNSTVDFEEHVVTDPEIGEYVASVGPAYTPFEVKIQAQNSRGEGPISTPAIVYSYQRKPEVAPSGITAKPLSTSTIQVSWTGIDATQIVGELLGYKIKHWAENSTEELGDIVGSPGLATKATITQLETGTTYSINVMAYTGGGVGPSSTEPTQVTTLRAAPQQAPRGVVVELKGTSITVKWNPITTSANEEPLQGYKVLYWVQGAHEEDATEKIVDKDTTKITIGGLKETTTYFINVKGYNAGGDGVASKPPKSIKTEEKETTAGQHSSASSITKSALLVLLPLLVAFHLR